MRKIKWMSTCAVSAASLLLMVNVAQAGALQKIKSRGFITVVASGGYPPFSYFNARNQLVGFDIDVAHNLAKEMGLKLHMDSAVFATIIRGVRIGAFDVAIASQTYTPLRAKAVQYLKHPYWCGGAQLFVKKGSNIKSMNDLSGQSVAVAAGTTYDAYVRKHNIPHLTFKHDPAAMEAVETGQAGAAITGLIAGLNAIGKGVALQPVGHLLFRENIGITIKKGEPGLYAALNKAMLKLRDSGYLKSLSMKWFHRDITACSKTVTFPE